jgi:inorganic pyrophosphatase
MTLNNISPGVHAPDDIHVVIEIPAHADPIKYEVDKESGVLFVDRFMSASMRYPCNYGYIPNTLSLDGDPTDVLVMSPFSLLPGSVIRCRPLGMLRMEDESGPDAKLLAVPIEKITKQYAKVDSYKDLDPQFLASIEHFFRHYKDLEADKWVKIDGWEDVEAATNEIRESIDRYNSDS